MLEGVLNEYYHTESVRRDIGLASNNTAVLSYSGTTGQFTYNHPTSDGVLEGQTNQYYTDARARAAITLNSDDNQILSYGSISGEFTFVTPSTTKILKVFLFRLKTRAQAAVPKKKRKK